jgi:uncharacterized protein with GYD domain
MPKYLVHARYTAEGLRGLIKDMASGRKAAVQKALKGLGGKLESMYYCFGKDDVILITDLPDNTAAAAMSIAVGASGLVDLQVTPLLTIEEIDKAVTLKSAYRAPGGE